MEIVNNFNRFRLYHVNQNIVHVGLRLKFFNVILIQVRLRLRVFDPKSKLTCHKHNPMTWTIKSSFGSHEDRMFQGQNTKTKQKKKVEKKFIFILDMREIYSCEIWFNPKLHYTHHNKNFLKTSSNFSSRHTISYTKVLLTIIYKLKKKKNWICIYSELNKGSNLFKNLYE